MFTPYLQQWDLLAEGDPIATAHAQLLPVRSGDTPAMLKITTAEEERLGGILMEWWDGDGAARMLARDRNAMLLERATGSASLSEMARSGRDDEAARILCDTAARLHAPRAKPRPAGLIPLTRLFEELEPAAAAYGGILVRSFQTAQALLSDPRDETALHGDLHHDNVLDFGPRGWLAIDPKFLVGERGFDFANIFTNPDLADPEHPVATLPDRFARRFEIVSRHADLEPKRLLHWILAWTGLSAAWFLGDDDPLARIDLAIAERAATELDR